MQVTHIASTPKAEELILYIARVSSDQTKTGSGLLGYLIRNKHWSPFEHAYMTLEIVTSRAIAPQILRHRSFTFQEFSQRYAEVTGWEMYGARKQGVTNRQSSTDPASDDVQKWWQETQTLIADRAMAYYQDARRLGIAKELARVILPLSVQTKLYMTGSLRSWIHYFDLRCDEHAQLEHREIALKAQDIFTAKFPIIAQALSERDG